MAENLQLQAARKRKCWSLKKAADACDVSLPTFFRWEHGEQKPHGYNLGRLCEVFDASMEELGYAPSFENAVEPDDQQQSALSLLKDKTMNPERRNILRLAVGATSIAVAAPLTSLMVHAEPWQRLMTGKPSNVNAGTITHFRSLIKTCWELSNSGELEVAEGILLQLLPRLQDLASYQAEVADLSSQGLQLKSILVAHNLKILDKIALCQMAVAYGEGSDTNTFVAGLAQLAIAYQYAGQFKEALAVYQEALKHSHRVSPLLQSRIFVESAAMFAKHDRKKESRFYLDLAYEVYPTSPQDDPSFLFADCSSAILSLHAGSAYLSMGQPAEALKSFVSHQSSGEVIPARIGIEVLNHQGRAAIAQGNLEMYAKCLSDGLSGASIIRSQKRYSEALTVFREEVPVFWHKEPQIKLLMEQYSL